jgi:hypothetical protein
MLAEFGQEHGPSLLERGDLSTELLQFASRASDGQTDQRIVAREFAARG